MKTHLKFLLSLLVLSTLGAGSYDYLGPDRVRTTYVMQRKHCFYTANVGAFGCHLNLYTTPDGSCPDAGSTKGYFTVAMCSDSTHTWPGCGASCNPVGPTVSIEGCSGGDQGCRSVAAQVVYPEAAASANIICSNPGSNGWCKGAASLEINTNEPVPGFNILTVEGTRNGGSFACTGTTCSVPLLEGVNDLTFWALSSWGDSSGMGTATGLVDTQAPYVSGSLSGIAGSGGWFVSGVEVSASASDATSGIGSIVYSLDGAPQSAYTGPFSVGDGTHSIVFTATDVAGNSSSQTVNVNVDLGQPVLIIDPASGVPGSGGWFLSSATVSASATDGVSGLASFEYSIDGGSSTAYAGPVSLGDGSHTVVFTAADQAGNSVSGSSTVHVDTQAPQLILDADDRFCPACVGTTAIDYSVGDPISGVTAWSLMVDGVLLTSGTAAETGTYIWDGSGLSVGPHTITLAARDLAGNLIQTDMPVTILAYDPPEAQVERPESRKIIPGSQATATQTPKATATSQSANGQPADSGDNPATGPTATRTNAVVAFSGIPTSSGNPATLATTTTPISANTAIFGAAAAAAIGSTMAIVLEQQRKRKEEEYQEAIAAAVFNQAQANIEKQRKIEAGLRADNLKKLEEAISDAESLGVSPEKAEEYRKLYEEGKIDELTKQMHEDTQAALKEKMPEYLAAAEHSPEAKKWLEENILKYSDDYQQKMQDYLLAQLPGDYQSAMEHSPESKQWIEDNTSELLRKFLEEEALRKTAYISPEAKAAMEHSPEARRYILDNVDELMAQYQAQLAAIEQARKEKVASELGGMYDAAMQHSAEAKEWIVNNADVLMAQYLADLELQKKVQEALEAAKAKEDKPWWQQGWKDIVDLITAPSQNYGPLISPPWLPKPEYAEAATSLSGEFLKAILGEDNYNQLYESLSGVREGIQAFYNSPVVNSITNIFSYGTGISAQFMDDITFGLFGTILGVNWENGGFFFQQGRSVGRALSTTVAVVESAIGLGLFLSGFSLVPATGGGTLACAASTGPLAPGCVVIGGIALSIELASVVAGTAILGHGGGVFFRNGSTSSRSDDPSLNYGTNSGDTSTNAKRLRKDMGVGDTPGKEPHHIVPSTNQNPYARACREILNKYGIDINQKINGLLLDSKYNKQLNSSAYMKAVYEELKFATSKEEVMEILERIARQIVDGTFPH